MNKRIKDLYRQALETEFDYAAGEGVKPGEYYSNYKTVLNAEKFAELIVRECGKIVSGLVIPETFEQDIGPYEKWNQALGHAALEIEQHFFGFEE